MSKMQTSNITEKKMYELKRQIITTAWDIPLINNEKTRMLKLQKLEELKRKLNKLKNMEVEQR